MALLPDLEALVRSFLSVRRSLTQKMCVAAFGRVQEDRQDGNEFGIALMFKEIGTHAGILYDCRRFGADFGPAPTVARMMQHMRFVEELRRGDTALFRAQASRLLESRAPPVELHQYSAPRQRAIWVPVAPAL